MSNRALAKMGSRGATAAKTEWAHNAAPAFLMDLVNLQPSKAAVDRIIKNYPLHLPDRILTTGVVEKLKTIGCDLKTDLPKIEQRLDASVEQPGYWIVLYLSRFYMRVIWEAPSNRIKGWRIFWLRVFYKSLVELDSDPGLDLLEPPPFTPFDVAMMFLHTNIYKALLCRNPDCPAPYFFGTKKGQKYCTPVCTYKAQVEYKRRWWSKVGSDRRKEKKQ